MTSQIYLTAKPDRRRPVCPFVPSNMLNTANIHLYEYLKVAINHFNMNNRSHDDLYMSPLVRTPRFIT